MLELYQAENCPYSETVRQELTELGVSYVIHNPRRHGGSIRNLQTQEELVTIGGQDQLPFLVDHSRDVTMYESNAIVEYLHQHYA